MTGSHSYADVTGWLRRAALPRSGQIRHRPALLGHVQHESSKIVH